MVMYEYHGQQHHHVIQHCSRNLENSKCVSRNCWRVHCSHTLFWTNVANYADQINYTICGEEMETSPHHPPFSEMNLNNTMEPAKKTSTASRWESCTVGTFHYLSMTFLVRCFPSFPPEDCPAIPGGWSYLPEQTTDWWDVSQATSLRNSLGKEPAKKT